MPHPELVLGLIWLHAVQHGQGTVDLLQELAFSSRRPRVSCSTCFERQASALSCASVCIGCGVCMVASWIEMA